MRWFSWKMSTHQLAQLATLVVNFVCFRGKCVSSYTFSKGCTCKMLLGSNVGLRSYVGSRSLFQWVWSEYVRSIVEWYRTVWQCESRATSVSGPAFLCWVKKTVLCCINPVYGCWSCKVYVDAGSIAQIKVAPNLVRMLPNGGVYWHVQPSHWLMLQRCMELATCTKACISGGQVIRGATHGRFLRAMPS